MRDLIAEVEEMLKPANIPVHLQYELALEAQAREFKPAVGLAPEDSGALCAECPRQEGCSHVCQIEWEESGGEG